MKTHFLKTNRILVLAIFLISAGVFISSCTKKNDELVKPNISINEMSGDRQNLPDIIKVPGLYTYFSEEGCWDCLRTLQWCFWIVLKENGGNDPIEADIYFPDENNEFGNSEAIPVNIHSYVSNPTLLQEDEIEDVLTFDSETSHYTMYGLDSENDTNYLSIITFSGDF